MIVLTKMILPEVFWLNSEYRKRLIKKYSRSSEEELLAARLIDKFEAVRGKNTPQSTRFLTQGEQEMAERLLAELGQRHIRRGGYEGAERACLLLLPDWMDEETAVEGSADPVAVIRAHFKADLDGGKKPVHRDFLGALIALGIERDAVGDILPGEDACDIAVLREVLPYLLGSLNRAGRFALKTEAVERARPVEQEFRLIKDTLASLRLDSVAAAGFSLSREKASQAISGGRVALNGAECLKPDKSLTEGDKISMRGLGKLELSAVKGQSRKGRIIVEIKRFI